MDGLVYIKYFWKIICFVQRSLQEYENDNNYFKIGSYNPFCNNCQDFVKLYLEILSNEDKGKSLVFRYTINIIKENYTYSITSKDNKWTIDPINVITITNIKKMLSD